MLILLKNKILLHGEKVKELLYNYFLFFSPTKTSIPKRKKSLRMDGAEVQIAIFELHPLQVSILISSDYISKSFYFNTHLRYSAYSTT